MVMQTSSLQPHDFGPVNQGVVDFVTAHVDEWRLHFDSYFLKTNKFSIPSDNIISKCHALLSRVEKSKIIAICVDFVVNGDSSPCKRCVGIIDCAVNAMDTFYTERFQLASRVNDKERARDYFYKYLCPTIIWQSDVPDELRYRSQNDFLCCSIVPLPFVYFRQIKLEGRSEIGGLQYDCSVEESNLFYSHYNGLHSTFVRIRRCPSLS